MTVEGFEYVSSRIGKKAFEGDGRSGDAEVWATDCPLAALQFATTRRHVKPMHPMSVLARAYREDGFPKKVEPAGD